jgi:hypothetical protein
MIHKDPVSLFALQSWTDGTKHVISHTSTAIEFRQGAALVGSNEELIDFARNFPYKVGALYVAADSAILSDMEAARPELEYFKLMLPKRVHVTNLKEQDARWYGASAERSREARVRADQLF